MDFQLKRGTAEGNVECQGPGETHESSHGDARDRAAKQQPPVVTWTEVSPKRPPGRQLGQPTLQRGMGNRQLVAVPRAGGDGHLQDCRGGGVVLHNGTACAEARGSAQHQPDRERLCVVLPDEGDVVDGAKHAQGHNGLAESQSREPSAPHPDTPLEAAAEVHHGLAAMLGCVLGNGGIQEAGSRNRDPQ